jgi:hypothetical protein
MEILSPTVAINAELAKLDAYAFSAALATKLQSRLTPKP